MSTKQKIGYFILFLSGGLLLFGLGMLPTMYQALLGFIGIFFKPISDYEVGRAIGSFIWWIFYVGSSVFLLDLGLSWIKRPVDPF